jgi:hypothetical protein
MTSGIAERYRRFAEDEAKGRSPLYETLARGVAGDSFALSFLAALPQEKRQPNLLFAALRHVCGTPRDWNSFRALLEAHSSAVRAVILARRTQTNEPGRCATLLPVLGQLPQPLALIEVGASAGLCLLPDRYGYDFGTRVLRPAQAVEMSPMFPCSANPSTPLPASPPHVAWRAGLDLAPVDLHDPAEVGWLETLVWPGQPQRLERLRAAIRIASVDPPRIIKGDLKEAFPALAGEAPRDACLVVFHSAVLAYVPRAERDRFIASVRNLEAVWVSNEAPQVLSHVISVPDGGPGSGFLMAVNGEPVAWTDPHGSWIEWISSRSLRL